MTSFKSHNHSGLETVVVEIVNVPVMKLRSKEAWYLLDLSFTQR